MGAGKSTVLNSIKEKGILCIEEPAREILKEQRKINGAGVPEINPGSPFDFSTGAGVKTTPSHTFLPEFGRGCNAPFKSKARKALVDPQVRS